MFIRVQGLGQGLSMDNLEKLLLGLDIKSIPQREVLSHTRLDLPNIHSKHHPDCL